MDTKYPGTLENKKGKRFFIYKKELNKGNLCTNVLSLTLNGVINNNPDKPIGLSPKDYATYQIFDKDNLVFKLIDLENISTSRVGLVPERGIMSSAYIRLINRHECNMRYFYFQYYDLYLRHVYNGLGAGVRSTLTSTDLLDLLIFIPPQSEQNHIVRFLDWKISSINRLIPTTAITIGNAIAKSNSLLARQIMLLQELKIRLISDTVTGKIDVRDIEIPAYESVADKMMDTTTDESIDDVPRTEEM